MTTASLTALRRRASTLLLAAALWAGAAVPAGAVELIVNSSVHQGSVSPTLARAIFAMKMNKWADGQPVLVFVLADESSEHRSLCKQVLDLYPYQLRESWNRLIYTGTGQAPISVNSEEEMIRKVASTPGAIGYITKAEKNEAYRLLPVR